MCSAVLEGYGMPASGAAATPPLWSSTWKKIRRARWLVNQFWQTLLRLGGSQTSQILLMRLTAMFGASLSFQMVRAFRYVPPINDDSWSSTSPGLANVNWEAARQCGHGLSAGWNPQHFSGGKYALTMVILSVICAEKTPKVCRICWCQGSCPTTYPKGSVGRFGIFQLISRPWGYCGYLGIIIGTRIARDSNCSCHCYLGGSINGGAPVAEWFIMENHGKTLLNLDDLGVPLF